MTRTYTTRNESEFPAPAGMIRSHRGRARLLRRVPRACGDDPGHPNPVDATHQSSPRLRG